MVRLQSITFLAGMGIKGVGVNTMRYDGLAEGGPFLYAIHHHPRPALLRKMLHLLRQAGWREYVGVTEDSSLGVIYSRPLEEVTKDAKPQ